MTDHYFSNQPQSQHKLHQFEAILRNQAYQFVTDAGVFSRDDVDTGSRLLIEALPCQPGETVLDLGCGYGPIGVVAARLVAPTGHVYLLDVNERAVHLSQTNIQRNNIKNATVVLAEEDHGWPSIAFDWIFTNPPIRAGKQVVQELMRRSWHALKPGGGLLVVIRTKQGAKSLEKFLHELFGNCQIVARGSGFRVFSCLKHLHP